MVMYALSPVHRLRTVRSLSLLRPCAGTWEHSCRIGAMGETLDNLSPCLKGPAVRTAAETFDGVIDEFRIYG